MSVCVSIVCDTRASRPAFSKLLDVSLSVFLFVCLFVCLCVSMSVCMSVVRDTRASRPAFSKLLDVSTEFVCVFVSEFVCLFVSLFVSLHSVSDSIFEIEFQLARQYFVFSAVTLSFLIFLDDDVILVS